MGRQALIESVMRVKIEMSVDGGGKEQQWGRVLEGADKGRDSEGRERGVERGEGRGEGGGGRGVDTLSSALCSMVSPFLNQSRSPTQSLTFKFMATVGNLNIKAAAIIDSRLLIFQAGATLLHHRQSVSPCDGTKRKAKETAARQGRGGGHLQSWSGAGEAGGVKGWRVTADGGGDRGVKQQAQQLKVSLAVPQRNLGGPNQRLRPEGTNSRLVQI